MTSTPFSQSGLTSFQQLLGHSKGILEKWIPLEDYIYSSGTFSVELEERVRRTLAFHNGCEYYTVKGIPSEDRTDPRIQSAVHAAGLSSSKTHISDNEINTLKEIFTDSEIAGFLALTCFITTCQRFDALLGLETNCQI